ncbi:glycosyltransferase family 22 protein [Aulographum hederae CBS 113979]|uniref:Mannosyltransferase n=1 Tax=Aulographum hederae CBS 113979 TaxID=1176131 RepID=A0A6G1HHM6_9PEZI|nr:glycosyltransferase family 22 protein [Aulographum hederae CBS 113979]
MALSNSLLALVIPALILVHVYVAPFTKVEESFNIQATHDILTYGVPPWNATQFLSEHYDHFTFPGAVPRTFVGALILAGLSRPFIAFFDGLLERQMLVRAILGLINAVSLHFFARSVSQTFGPVARNCYILLQASQFHVIYYASRTIPNSYAFCLTTLALRALLLSTTHFPVRSPRRQQRLCLYFLTLATIIFRSEIAILVMATALLILWTSPEPIFYTIGETIFPAGLVGSIIGIALTMIIDSHFWDLPNHWPEARAFFFNTIQGHSSDWGTSPWHYYVTSALPRLLLNPFFLLYTAVALGNPSTRKRSMVLMTPLIAFIVLFSVLPHKETRFIIYTVPGFTAVASVGASWAWVRRAKSWGYRLLSATVLLTIPASFAISCLLLVLSSVNYPGGEALMRLHSLAATQGQGNTTTVVRVHLDDLTCQTGATRWLQKPNWIYDKTEDKTLLRTPIFWQQFDYVLAESPELVIGKFEILDTIFAYGGIVVLRRGQEPAVRALNGTDLEGSSGVVRAMRQFDRMAEVRKVENLVREKVSKGVWGEIKIVPKIYILKRQPPSVDVDIAAEVEAGVI